jgi:tRNA dimethylallyltransferase
LGYAQFLKVLDSTPGDPRAVERAILATTQATRRFVRRQRSWFRRDHRMIELAADRPDLMDRALEAVAAAPVR